METGLFTESFEDYRARPGLNISTIKPLLDGFSPGEAVIKNDKQTRPTAGMKLGTLIHDRAEQNAFERKYKVIPEFSFRSKADKTEAIRWACRYGDIEGSVLSEPKGVERLSGCKKEEIEQEIYRVTKKAGITFVTREMYDRAVGAYNSIIAHPVAGDLWRSGVAREQSAVAYFEDVPLKGRFDNRSEEYRAIIDIKSTDDARSRSVLRKCRKLRYGFQAAQYAYIAWQLGLDIKEVVFIFVCNHAPFRVEVVRMEEPEICMYQTKLPKYWRLYWECKKTGVWPASTCETLKLEPESWELDL